jgi:hypothetical protein
MVRGVGSDGGSLLGASAEWLAVVLLASMPLRMRHTRGVVQQARSARGLVTAEDFDVLEAAAWLHDIGYAPSVRDSGFHPLDGARYLKQHGWPSRVCGLVAYHSAAHLVAEAQDLAAELSEFEREHDLVADILTYADQTTGPNGETMTIDHRIADMLRRHGPGSVNALVHPIRGPYLRSVVDGVEEALRQLDPDLSR